MVDQSVLGICQWFHYLDHAEVQRTASLMKELGATHLRTGLSWADYHRPEGRRWYGWVLDQLADFNVLLSVWHTPPSLAEGGICAGPPRRLQDYADFLDRIISEYGDRFDDLELWNEPNNRLKWAFDRFDPQWEKFGRMITMAGHWARQRGKRTVLGGIIPVDHHWLNLMKRYGALEHVDVVALHGFPEMWWNHAPNWDWYRDWRGWEEKLAYIRPHAGGRAIWVTETGLATCDVDTGRRCRHELQVSALEKAAAAPTPRLYWYSMIDLAPDRRAIEGYHVDENEYHMGLVTHAGEKKPAWFRLRDLLAQRRPEA